MRATCEQCVQLQPAGWVAGDLCAHCGCAVRREVRCYWCVKWTPLAKFCRSCGAAVVEDRWYGAARMLKDAGSDRFSIPKQLVEFDPEQIENFSRIYQQHAGVAERHVDDLVFVESFLRQRCWSGPLHERLTAELPWPEETLARLTRPRAVEQGPLERLQQLCETAAFAETQQLALVARLRLDDWTAARGVAQVFQASDGAVCEEAALALTSWRALTAVRGPRLGDDVVEALRRSKFTGAAAVRLAALRPASVEVPAEALDDPDDETAFGAALHLRDRQRLAAGLERSPLHRLAAAQALARDGAHALLQGPLRDGPAEVREAVLAILASAREPAPPLSQALLELVETSESPSAREQAARVLCRDATPETVLRVVKAARGDRAIYQSVLQRAPLAEGPLVEVLRWLVAQGKFAMGQYGLAEVAKARAPDRFVPDCFAGADDATRAELLRFAEVQLGERGDEGLHRFVLQVVFGDYPAATRAAAWWTLHRWYRSLGEHRGEGPLRLQRAPVARFFGSVEAFLPGLTGLLRDGAALREVGLYDFVASLLGSADEEFIADVQRAEGAGLALVEALGEVSAGDYWPYLLDSAVRLLGQAGDCDAWRAAARASLERRPRAGNYHFDKALERLAPGPAAAPEVRVAEPVADAGAPAAPSDAPSAAEAEPAEPAVEPADAEEPVFSSSNSSPSSLPSCGFEAPRDYAAMGLQAQEWGRQLQEEVARVMAGPASVEEKIKTATRHGEEFQARIKQLYGA